MEVFSTIQYIGTYMSDLIPRRRLLPHDVFGTMNNNRGATVLHTIMPSIETNWVLQ